ncbi:tdcF protein [Shigella dysenteriae 1617]|uniref:Endoribonuclease L-PSP n=1 Tax=Shigella dysenteriae TaxID=622 RepID=A0A2X2HNR7_SHIDY|nr:tdcF protein [Shigella dysenteriae 1617]SPZ67766.1 endoribonuclease L-PSP [Shigella dysenteriae]
MKKIIETQRAPGAIGPYVQGVDLGSMVFTYRANSGFPTDR